MDGSISKPPQISEMLQKFAFAFKAKTSEFFADGAGDPPAGDSCDEFSLLDSEDAVISGQRVVVIKPDHRAGNTETEVSHSLTSILTPELGDSIVANETRVKVFEQLGNLAAIVQQLPVVGFGVKEKLSECKANDSKTRIMEALISSIFATVSSFEASYVQLQIAHVPFDEESIRNADKALVCSLQRLSEIKKVYGEFRKNPDFGKDLSIGSCLEAQVVENQSKLRTLGTVSNHLQAEIDRKDRDELSLRRKLGEIQNSNSALWKKISDVSASSCDAFLSVKVFESVLRDACEQTSKFVSILMNLMRKAGWDLNLAATSIYPSTNFSKKRHVRHAFMSYICLGMLEGFDSIGFGITDNGVVPNEHASSQATTISSLKDLLEHLSANPMEVLSKDRNCNFARFCEKKYQLLIHPTLESSIFTNMDQNEAVLNSWMSVRLFYDAFIRMASSIWTLHKVAFSLDPMIEIFQVERGTKFSMIYMEDVRKEHISPSEARPKVGFTVVPGFRVCKTVIQSQVYLLE